MIHVLQDIMNKLCSEYELGYIPVVLEQNPCGMIGTSGAFNCNTTFWYISICSTDAPIVQMMAAHHEFRHYWQRIHYADLHFLRWKTYANEFRPYYGTIVDVLEADARIFGCTKGQYNLRELLDEYPVESLERIIQTNTLSWTKEYLSLRYSGQAHFLSSNGVLGFSP